jgi:hypothetical protein
VVGGGRDEGEETHGLDWPGRASRDTRAARYEARAGYTIAVSEHNHRK